MSTYSLIDLLTLISPILILIGVLIGFLKFKKMDSLHRILLFYLLICLSTDLLSRFFSEIYGNNLVLMPFFNLLEFISISIIFIVLLPAKRELILILILTVFSIYFIEFLYLKKPLSGSKTIYSYIFSSLAISFLSIYLYVNQLVNSKIKHKTVNNLNASIMLYFSLKLFFNIPLSFFIFESSDIKYFFWLIFLMNTLVFYGIIAFSLWKSGKIQVK
jgi:hypothetical protein